MKGILDVVTILPDSIGWKQKLGSLGPERLQDAGELRVALSFSDHNCIYLHIH